MTDRLELARLYADVGGIDAVPEELRAHLPRDKQDIVRAESAIGLGFPAVGPILPHLLTWLQDANWPVCAPIAAFLATVGAPLLDPIRAVLASRDDIWKYGVLAFVVKANVALRTLLSDDLRRIVQSPTEGERAEDVWEIASELLDIGR